MKKIMKKRKMIRMKFSLGILPIFFFVSHSKCLVFSQVSLFSWSHSP